MKCTIGIVQIASTWGNAQATLLKAARCLRRAAEGGAHLCCFPEQFPTGWSPREIRSAEGPDGEIVHGLRTLAQEYGIAILGSFTEQYDPHPRNTAIAIDPEGNILATYAKIHLFTPEEEDMHYTPGDALAEFAVQGVRCGIAICYDLRFPELFRLYAGRGVHCVLVPAAWPCVRMDAWHLFCRARALENQFYLAGANCTGYSPIAHYCGGSVVVDPAGIIISSAGDAETLLLAEIDTDRIDEVRRAMPAIPDRREALYRTL
ncbi:MAG: carbon-nitrogen hydrolase family protein [Methanomicrobiales archaeon]|nr:carbon-nitrogen hydrolase family protein [Methanomicrobiales archaeon]